MKEETGWSSSSEISGSQMSYMRDSGTWNIQAAPAAEINEHVHLDIEEDPLPGGSRRRTREDEEEENSSKRLRGDMEGFGYSDSWTSDDDDEDADIEVNHGATKG